MSKNGSDPAVRFSSLAADEIRNWLSVRLNVLFLILIILHLLPVWLFSYFPSQDGPAHLNNANALREYWNPEASIFRDYYTINDRLNANWLGHSLLAGLMYIVPAAIAEKLLLSVYILSFPISVRYALGATGLSPAATAFLAFPLIYNYSFHMGFYNFCYSLVVFFFCLGYWLSHQGRFTLGQTATLALLSLLLYFCHVLSLVMLYIAVAALLLGDALSELSRSRSFGKSWDQLKRKLFFPLLAFIPSLTLTLSFLQQQGLGGIASPSVWKDLKNLMVLGLVSYQQAEVFVYWLLGLGLISLAGFLFLRNSIRRTVQGGGFLIVLAAFLLVYITVPQVMAGGGIIHPRVALYIGFALLLWLGAQTYSKPLQNTLAASAGGLGLILLGLHTVKYGELNDYLQEYTSAGRFIEPNTTLLPVALTAPSELGVNYPVSLRVDPFLHAAGYIGTERRIIDFTNYEADTDYFPLRFRPSLNPYRHIGNAEKRPFQLDLLRYSSRTGGTIDYVLLWGNNDARRFSQPDIKALVRQLAIGYELIYISPPRGLVQLYRRKRWRL